jgi:hypothetical protein
MKEPVNEQGVIVIFSRDCERFGFEVISIGSSFPDAVVRKGGKNYLVEFEYVSSNFISHDHDPAECDLIICWEDNRPGSFPIPVIELSDPNWHEKNIEFSCSELVRRWQEYATCLKRDLENEKSKRSISATGQIDPILRQTYQIDGLLAAGLSQNRAAEIVGITPSTLRNRIKGLNGDSLSHRKEGA